MILNKIASLSRDVAPWMVRMEKVFLSIDLVNGSSTAP